MDREPAASTKDEGSSLAGAAGSPLRGGRSILQFNLAHLHLFTRLLQDDGLPLRRLLRRAGEARHQDVDVRLAAEQVRVGTVIVDDDLVLARQRLDGLVALGAVPLRLILRQFAAVLRAI